VFESPGRTAATLRDLAGACGDARPGAVCRELTKVHEQVVRGTLGELAAAARSGSIPARGEVVIVVGWEGPAGRAERAPADADAALVTARAAVERLVADGVARGDAARRVSAETGIPRRALYAATRGR
jgi:16S rRNA (cytidine1402-2'-O)-methyltransferase